MVFVESLENNDVNIRRLSRLKIAKKIFNLNLNKLNKIHIERNRIGIKFEDFSGANSFINNNQLKEKGFKIFILNNLMCCKCIIGYVDVDFSIEEILDNLKSHAKIINIIRLNRKVIDKDSVSYKPTGTILVTFDGTSLPKDVTIYGLPLLVHPYIAPITHNVFGV